MLNAFSLPLPPRVWEVRSGGLAERKTLSTTRSLTIQKVNTGKTLSDFAEIAISAAGELDLEGRFSL
jgi:hypothetical protein